MMFENLLSNDTRLVFLIVLLVLSLIYICYRQWKWRQLVISTMEAIIEIPKKLEDIDSSIEELEKSIKIHHISAVDE